MIEPFFALANITSPALIETVAFALAFAAITILQGEAMMSMFVTHRLKSRPFVLAFTG